MKETVLAICYDFDKTLSPDDMQAQGYIQSVHYDVEDFWEESDSMAKRNEMDSNLSYMYLMKKSSRGKFELTREALAAYGAQVALYAGAEEWFGRINAFGKEHGVQVEHFVLSSGVKEMIEGTRIAHNFRKIYACSYYYDKAGVAVWPAQTVNYTNKTQFLYRISKDALEINDPAVNAYVAPEAIRVPFRNLVYFGDSDTDIPCMELVNKKGGYSVGVFDPEKNDRAKVYRMMRENRIRFFAAADYREGSVLDRLIKDIILRTAANELLEQFHAEELKEANGEQ